MTHFVFSNSPKDYFEEKSFIAHLSKIEGEEELLQNLYKNLNFPSYFGFNWNAVYDCLRDFSWVEDRIVIIVHDDRPQLNESTLKLYLQVLNDATIDWKVEDDHQLKIIFPEQMKEEVFMFFEKRL